MGKHEHTEQTNSGDQNAHSPDAVPHSGHLPPEQGGELPVHEFNTPLPNAVAKGVVRPVPATPAELAPTAPERRFSWPVRIAAGLTVAAAAVTVGVAYAARSRTVDGHPVAASRPGPSTAPPRNRESTSSSPSVSPTAVSLIEQYPPVMPAFSPDAKDINNAAYLLLRDLNMYDITGNKIYLDAAMPRRLVQQQYLDQARADEVQKQDVLYQFQPPQRQQEAEKIAQDFTLVRAHEVDDNGTIFDLDVTTHEYDPFMKKQGYSGNLLIGRSVTLGVITDAEGKGTFYLASSTIDSSVQAGK